MGGVVGAAAVGGGDSEGPSWRCGEAKVTLARHRGGAAAVMWSPPHSRRGIH